MGEIMISPKGVKLGVPERVSISCPTCGTHHDLPSNNWKPVTYIMNGSVDQSKFGCIICLRHLKRQQIYQ